jgi:YidC/Oxa1 family membrane protein insertase
VRLLEKLRGTTQKNIVEQGYVLLDELIRQVDTVVKASSQDVPEASTPITALVAPSWGPDGLLENHALELVEPLLSSGIRVILRPHIRTFQLKPDAINSVLSAFGSNSLLTIDRDPNPASSFAAADVMISAWSGVAFEFAMSWRKPVVSVDVPRKNFNPSYLKIDVEPFEVAAREKIGVVVSPTELNKVPLAVRDLASDKEQWANRLSSFAQENVFNLGRSAQVAADALESIMNQPRKFE